jgi:hypothetical protein
LKSWTGFWLLDNPRAARPVCLSVSDEVELA